jgi:hypothetical protein
MSHNLVPLKQDVASASHTVDNAEDGLQATEPACQNATVRFNVTASTAGGASNRIVITDC